MKVPFETDAAMLAVFDPKVLLHRMRQPSTWWREGNALDLDEVLEGKVALFPLGDEGSYALRLSLDPATAILEGERPLVRGAVAGLGITVISEEVFLGAAERLPGDGVGDRVLQIPGTGHFHKVPAGDYDLTVHVLDWRTNKSFFDEDGEPLPAAPPDFVVVLAKRERAFDAPLELRPLLDLLPKAEAKASALRVPPPVRRAIVTRAPSAGRSASSPSTYVIDEEPPAPPSWGLFELDLVRRAFRDVLRAHRAVTIPDARFAGGTMLWKPRDPALLAKDTPVDDIYGKVLKVRNEMRVLEQKVNAHEGLAEEEQLNLDARITGVYDAVNDLLTVFAAGPSTPAPAPAAPVPAPAPAPAPPPKLVVAAPPPIPTTPPPPPPPPPSDAEW